MTPPPPASERGSCLYLSAKGILVRTQRVCIYILLCFYNNLPLQLIRIPLFTLRRASSSTPLFGPTLIRYRRPGIVF